MDTCQAPEVGDVFLVSRIIKSFHGEVLGEVESMVTVVVTQINSWQIRVLPVWNGEITDIKPPEIIEISEEEFPLNFFNLGVPMNLLIFNETPMLPINLEKRIGNRLKQDVMERINQSRRDFWDLKEGTGEKSEFFRKFEHLAYPVNKHLWEDD